MIIYKLCFYVTIVMYRETQRVLEKSLGYLIFVLHIFGRGKFM